VVAVKKKEKKSKSNGNVSEKDVIKIVAEYKRSKSILVAISERRKSNCSGFAKT
jgi:hypothetical protein